MQIDVLTLFPKMFFSPFEESIIKRAKEKEIVKINIHNIRDFALDKHKQVDDKPFGGVPGMVLKIEPIYRAFEQLNFLNVQKKIFLSPQGKLLTQSILFDLLSYDHLVLLCGHYEGVDERIIDLLITDEISIGNYVLSGGEIPAMVIIDAIVRLLPNAIGKKESLENESFSNNLLDYPVFTRPREFKSLKVPEVLLSGNHKEIEFFKKIEALKKTFKKRPDLINKDFFS
ncbi:MAG: tRNA (guanosine(37)-N1)-methyltransferase TrmD, partial [bacterium]